MTFTAQELQHRITLERLTITRDSDGDIIQTWTPIAQPFAKVEPLVGREYFAAAATQAEDTVKFTMRFRPDVRPADRIVHGGAHYDIKSIQNIKGRNRELLIYAKALNA